MASLQRARRPAIGADLSDLLRAGGDDRIAIDPETLANPYGCLPWPDAHIAAFGSSTASTVSAHGHAAAQDLADRVLAAPAGPELGGAAEFDRIRRELIHLCGLNAVGPEIVFAASGTDIHLLVAALLTSDGAALTTVVAGATETGRGVPSALTLRHFSGTAASGAKVAAGAAMGGAERSELIAAPIRHPDGGLRSIEEVDRDVAAAVLSARARGRKVLLALVDVSKTGVVAPSPGCARRLKRAFPDTVEVLVDACQFRLSGPSLRAYLADGFLVAITGSKFLTGPAFAGALLVPQSVGRRLEQCSLMSEAALYSARAEWPGSWVARTGLRAACNLGLLLRWEAALEELRRLTALPPANVADFFRRFGSAVQGRLASERVFEPLPLATLDRGLRADQAAWDQVPTIFPFLLRHSAPRTFREPFSVEETTRVHRLLRGDLPLELAERALATLPVELGQPVIIGERNGAPLAALRLCAGARTAVDALAAGRAGEERVIATALDALDKTALIARTVSQGRL